MGGFEFFPKDLFMDRFVYFDMVSINKYIGLSEVILNDISDVINVMLTLEKRRFT